MQAGWLADAGWLMLVDAAAMPEHQGRMQSVLNQKPKGKEDEEKKGERRPQKGLQKGQTREKRTENPIW